MQNAKRKAIVRVCAAMMLSACGASDGGTDRASSGPIEPDVPDAPGGEVGTTLPFSSTSDTQDSALRYVAVTSGGSGSNGNTGALDHDGGTISGGLLGGTLNGGRTEIDLIGGGTANLTNPDGNDFVRFFTFEGSQFNRFGVVGVQTGAANVPVTGSTTYNGRVRMQATNSDDSYDLTGNARVTANWGSTPNVTTLFSNLAGSGNETGPIVSGATGTITVSNANLSGGAFTGGTASGTGPLFDDLSGAASLSGSRGEFFGSDAAEVGGVLSVSQDDLRIVGVYAGD